MKIYLEKFFSAIPSIVKRSMAAMLCLIVVGLFVAYGCKKTEIPPDGREIQVISQGCNVEENIFVWSEGRKYYGAEGEEIYLDEVENKVVLCFDTNYRTEIELFLQRNSQILYMELGRDLCILTMENPDIKALRNECYKQTGIKSVNPLYSLADNPDYLEMFFTDEIVVKFKENVSQQEMENIYQKYRLEVREITRLFQVLSVPICLDPLEVSNAIQASGLVEYSEPDFRAKIILPW